MTGKGPTTGNLVSHSNIKTRTRWLPNLKRKKYLVTELGQTVSARLSTHAIKTIDKQGGFSRALLLAKDEGLSDKLLHVKKQLQKSLRKGAPKPSPKAEK
jgi:large subunit ribosomal protein L28